MDIQLLKNGVNKFLDISTAHISKTDDNILQKLVNPVFFKENSDIDSEPPLAVYDHDFGYWVHVSSDLSNINDMDSYIEAIIYAGFSIEFCELLIAANSLGCTFINFDCDGLQYEGVKKFDW